jgi:hypothetical protein
MNTRQVGCRLPTAGFFFSPEDAAMNPVLKQAVARYRKASRPAKYAGGQYGLRWRQFEGRNQTLVTKQKDFKTAAERDAFADKIEKAGNFMDFVAWSDPPASDKHARAGQRTKYAGKQDRSLDAKYNGKKPMYTERGDDYIKEYFVDGHVMHIRTYNRRDTTTTWETTTTPRSMFNRAGQRTRYSRIPQASSAAMSATSAASRASHAADDYPPPASSAAIMSSLAGQYIEGFKQGSPAKAHQNAASYHDETAAYHLANSKERPSAFSTMKHKEQAAAAAAHKKAADLHRAAAKQKFSRTGAVAKYDDPHGLVSVNGRKMPFSSKPAQYDKRMDHAEYPKRLKTMTDDQLRFIIRDAREAAQANPENPNAGFYQDEILYAAAELKRRGKSYARPGRPAKYAGAGPPFFIVVKPSDVSEVGDCVYPTSSWQQLQNYFRGGLDASEIAGCHQTKSAAEAQAKQLLARR